MTLVDPMCRAITPERLDSKGYKAIPRACLGLNGKNMSSTDGGVLHVPPQMEPSLSTFSLPSNFGPGSENLISLHPSPLSGLLGTFLANCCYHV